MNYSYDYCFLFRPWSNILKEHNVSEPEPVSGPRRDDGESPTYLFPLDRANISVWIVMENETEMVDRSPDTQQFKATVCWHKRV
jgi:hypothetical protein